MWIEKFCCSLFLLFLFDSTNTSITMGTADQDLMRCYEHSSKLLRPSSANFFWVVKKLFYSSAHRPATWPWPVYCVEFYFQLDKINCFILHVLGKEQPAMTGYCCV